MEYIKKENVNLTDIMAELAKVYKNAYNRTVEIYSGDAIEAVTNIQKLKQLLFIFLDNARKYSDELISVYIGQTSNEAYIRTNQEQRGWNTKGRIAKSVQSFLSVDKS